MVACFYSHTNFSYIYCFFIVVLFTSSGHSLYNCVCIDIKKIRWFANSFMHLIFFLTTDRSAATISFVFNGLFSAELQGRGQPSVIFTPRDNSWPNIPLLNRIQQSTVVVTFYIVL